MSVSATKLQNFHNVIDFSEITVVIVVFQFCNALLYFIEFI